jgi:hypothetical protein
MKTKLKLRPPLAVGIIVLVALNALAMWDFSTNMQKCQSTYKKQGPLPCAAIPTQYVIEEPEYTNKLLRSMNVTNVRI